jgi:uncharacterized membrane protein
MSPRDLFSFHVGVVLIDLVGGLLIVGYVIAAWSTLLRSGVVAQARLLVAEGAVLGLSFKTAGALLKTLELRTGEQMAMFGAVLALRVLLKRLFVWEWSRIGPSQPAGVTSRRSGARS